MIPFKYPELPHVRRHGPTGYDAYESYRPWLRDEFVFRCVYCLRREKWVIRHGNYDIDHLEAQADRPDLMLDYDNLIYSCHTCNLAKGRRQVPNPCNCMLAETVEVFEDGRISANTPEATRIIRVLGLDSPEHTEFRMNLIGIISLAKDHDPELFVSLMGYPETLPDLSQMRPLSNTRPEGIEQSCHARRQRNELPDIY